VPFKTAYVPDDHPDQAIVNYASQAGCDLIAIASHGSGGLRGMLIGSVVDKVLARAALPVLVFR
jgi:nucleotide-binding universal stress UspA family protein